MPRPGPRPEDAYQAAKVRQRQVSAAVPDTEPFLSQDEFEELMAASRSCDEELAALDAELRAPRRKLFPPPLPQSWWDCLDRVTSQQGEILARVDSATSIKRAAALLRSQVLNEERRCMSLLSGLAHDGWNVSALQGHARTARQLTAVADQSEQAHLFEAAHDALQGAYQQWRHVSDTATQVRRIEQGDVDVDVRILAQDDREEVRQASARFVAAFDRKDISCGGYWVDMVTVYERSRASQEDMRRRRSAQTEELTRAADRCWALHQQGVDVAAVNEMIDQAWEILDVQGPGPQAEELVRRIDSSLNDLESRVTPQQAPSSVPQPGGDTDQADAASATNPVDGDAGQSLAQHSSPAEGSPHAFR